MPSLDLVWNLIARDSASPAFARVGASADGASKSVGGFLKTMGAVGAGVAIGEAIKSAADFNAKMLLIQTQAGATAAEVRKMSPAMLSLAGRVAQAPEQLATSLYHVESTGLRGAKALEAVKVAAEGARVGHADLEETTNALTATIASGMVPATESFSQAMGQLNTIVGSGDMKLSDLNEALGTGVLVQVRQYGVTLNDVGAALADFGDNNIRGAEAATQLRMAVQALQTGSVNADSALGQIGLTIEQLRSDEQTGGLNKALTDLHSHLVNSGIDASKWGALMVDAFTKKAGGGITTLIGTYDRFEQKYKEVQDGASKFGDAWAATTKTAAFQFAQLKDTVDALGIQVGTVLLPPLNSVAHLLVTVVTPLGSAVRLFGELPQPVKDFAYALAGLKLASMIGLMGRLQGAVSGVTAAFAEEAALQRWSQTIGGITGAAAGAETNVSRLAVAQGVAARAMGGLRSAGSNLVTFLGGPWGVAFAGAVAIIPSFIDGLKQITGNTDQVMTAQQGLVEVLRQTNGAMDDNARKGAQQALIQAGLVHVFKEAGVSSGDAIDGLLGVAGAQDRVNAALQQYIVKHPGTVHNKDATAAMTARSAYEKLAESWGMSKEQAGYFADAANKASAATDKSGTSTKKASDSLALFGSTAGMTKDQITAAQKAIAAQQKQLEQDASSFVDPLKTYQDMAQAMAQKVADSTKSAKDSWSDYVKNVKIDLGQYATNLEQQLKDQEQWKQNLVTIAARAGADVAQQFADMGVQGAGLTAQMAHATGANFDRMAADMRQKAAEGGAGAATAIQEGMAIAAAKGELGAKATVQAIATQLGLGLDTVRQIANQYGIKLQEGLNPFLDALGHPLIGTVTGNRINAAFGQHWSGGYTGDGGKYEPKGVVHGGEFVFTKEQTAKAGVGALYNFASMLSGYSGGGFVSPSDVPHPPSLTPPFHPPVSTAGSGAMGKEYDLVTKFLAANAFAGGNTSIPGGRSAVTAAVQAIAASYGWGSGAEWQALVSVINRESGFNPNAANPTSSARGLFQKMTSIYGPVESTVPGQTYWGLNYIRSRYGDPLAAWRHEQQFGWYGKGTNYVPSDQFAFLHRGEAVVPASKNVQGAPWADGPMEITGTLEITGDGLARIIDGRIVGAFEMATGRGDYNP
jgi:TP901 family phage tail tape measure protein